MKAERVNGGSFSSCHCCRAAAARVVTPQQLAAGKPSARRGEEGGAEEENGNVLCRLRVRFAAAPSTHQVQRRNTQQHDGSSACGSDGGRAATGES